MPISGATVTVTDPSGQLLGIRQTDSSGLIAPITVTVPDLSESLDPNFQGQPFATVTLSVRHPAYAEINIQNVQVFSGVVTVQNLEMVPLAMLPNRLNPTEYFDIPPQNL